jgi:Ca-activated chloride channel family protein
VRFADPYLLALLALVPLLLFAKSRLERSRSTGFSNLGLMAGYRPTLRLRYRWLPTALRALALVLLVVAQRVLSQFIEGRKDDRIGLVVFRMDSLVLSPLTLDYQALTGLVNQVDSIDLRDGTAIGVGLSDGLNLLSESRARSRVVVLLTDGENNSGAIEPLTAARIAETLGLRVYTIGVKDADSSGPSNVDEQALQQMAELTGGSYFPAQSEEALAAVYDSIDSLEKSRVGRPQFGAYNEIAPYFLVAALLLLALEVAGRSTLWRQSA